MSIDLLVLDFLDKNNLGIKTMLNLYLPGAKDDHISSIKLSLLDKLKSKSAEFLYKNDDSSIDDLPVDDLYTDLFYLSNEFIKASAIPETKEKNNKKYLCPGCLFNNKKNIISIYNDVFKCKNCENELRELNDSKNIYFFRTFFIHNKSGYKCRDCNRFIPHPIDNSPTISCPYTDCIFVGTWSSLKKMNHPMVKQNEVCDSPSINDEIIQSKKIIKLSEDQKIKFSILKDVIDCQKHNIYYNNPTFALKLKYVCYDAFNNILNEYPEAMVKYLLENSRSGGFQCKIFQEYIRLLESEMPFSIKKNNKYYMVESLLDENLTLFNGISSYEEIVSDKLEVKNSTTEFYIGGRSGFISKPYFIGKLLNISEKDSKSILLDKVVGYNFSKIYLKDVKPGTEVIVTHLRAPPHYQMGGMVYVNRIRKNIIEEAIKLL